MSTKANRVSYPFCVSSTDSLLTDLEEITYAQIPSIPMWIPLMTSGHIPYFDFYPSDFMNGVRGMSAQEIGVYIMLLCRIYEDNAPVEFNILRLSTYCGMRQSTFQTVLEKLVALGKINIVDGMISNPRAGREISSRANKLKLNSKAGKASAEKRQQNQQTNSTDVQRTFNHTDTDTIERDIKSLSSASAENQDRKKAALSLSKMGIKAKDETHEQRASEYLESCPEISDLSFIATSKRYRAGMVDGHNPRFAPTPGEFAARARMVEVFRIGNIPAKSQAPPPSTGKTAFLKAYEAKQAGSQ